MTTYTELVDDASPALERMEARQRTRVAIAIDTSSIASGALETVAALQAEVGRRSLDVTLDRVGGTGLSFADPVVLVAAPDGTKVLYQHITADVVPAFVESCLSGSGDRRAEFALGVLEGNVEGVPAMMDHPWWAIQARRLMQDMGEIDPEDIDEALARGAYGGLERALGMTQEAVIAEVTASTLGGRGGSYFPTGRKWDFLRTSTSTPKAVVCNADEGDPGAWLNRMTMENDPHALIEGMLIAAWATGAARGYIYIREEYPLAFERMEKAVAQAYEKGILGPSVMGHEFVCDMDVVRGAGSYVCGEDSGLIASIEDARGMPKIRPPFPAASGVFGQGSNVNNVESYHTAAWVMRYGGERWKEVGTERNAGTKMFCASGHVERVGCFELPFGTSLRQLLDVCAGGLSAGQRLKAVQVGGPLTGIVPEFYLDLGMEPEVYRENKLGSLGGGGFVFLDESACVINLLTQLHWFLEDESCGRCTTCHGGTQRMVEILRRIQRGGGRASDIGKMQLLCDTLRYSNCQHGQLTPVTILHTLDWFKADLEEHIFERHCRAGVCKPLVRYEIAAQTGDLARAADYCPTDAIERVGDTYTIDDALCVRCNACREIAPEAVRVVDAFGPEAAIAREEPLSITAAG